jgi:hypothetical protein
MNALSSARDLTSDLEAQRRKYKDMPRDVLGKALTPGRRRELITYVHAFHATRSSRKGLGDEGRHLVRGLIAGATWIIGFHVSLFFARGDAVFGIDSLNNY